MVNSVNTNAGALVALQSLNKTNRELDGTQKRISTGFKVADGVDDGAAFAVAQGLRSDVRGLEAVGERLSSAKALLSVAQEGAKGVSDTVKEIRGVVTKLADASLSSDERTRYGADYTALVAEVNNFIAQSSFNGINLISGNAANTIIYNNDGGSFTLTGQNLNAASTTNLGAAPASYTGAQAALTASGAISTMESAVGAAIGQLGAYSRSVENQSNFLGALKDQIEVGIGNIVDADLAKESARLQSLQIRQQLGTQALSIANQSPSVLVSLFR